MSKEVDCGDVGRTKLGVLEIRNVVVIYCTQQLVLQRGVCVLVLAEDGNLLSVISVGLCDDSASGADRMYRVDVGRVRSGKHKSPVSHCLVLHVTDGEDHTYQLPVSVVEIYGGGIGVEMHHCGLN